MLLVHCRLLVDVAYALLGMVNSDLLLLHLLAGRGQFPSRYGNTDVHLRTCLHQSSMMLASTETSKRCESQDGVPKQHQLEDGQARCQKQMP
jgi:hypothetical protein